MRALLLLASVALASPASADIVIVANEPAPFAAEPVSAEALGEMRGGMLLPNGLSVAIGIDIQTRVNGLLVLHTVYASDGPAAGTRIFSPNTPGASGTGGAATVAPAGTVVSVTPMAGAQTIGIGGGAPPAAGGEGALALLPGGPAVATDAGSVSLQTTGTGQSVILNAGDLQVMHLLGRATGAVIANTANDRVIDTVSAINIEVMNASPLLASGLMTDEAAARSLVRSR